MEASVRQRKFLDMQVCVPSEWNDERIIAFAEKDNPAGTQLGWMIRKEGHKLLDGDPERGICKQDPHFVHIVLEV